LKNLQNTKCVFCKGLKGKDPNFSRLHKNYKARQVLLRAFSIGAQVQEAYYPWALSFIQNILWWHAVPNALKKLAEDFNRQY